MNDIKIKYISCYCTSSITLEILLQERHDEFVNNNPNIKLIDVKPSISGDRALLVIKYYESQKRDLMLEKQIKEFI